jgi:hypothetical protein
MPRPHDGFHAASTTAAKPFKLTVVAIRWRIRALDTLNLPRVDLIKIA